MSDSMSLHHRLDSEDIVNDKHARRAPGQAVCFQSIAHDLKRPQSTLRCLAVTAKVNDLDALLLGYSSLQFFYHVVRLQTRTSVCIIYKRMFLFQENIAHAHYLPKFTKHIFTLLKIFVNLFFEIRPYYPKFLSKGR
jgi:hypothetical protein